MGARYLEEGREWRLSGLLYTDDLILCGESEGSQKVAVDVLLRFIGDV